MDHITYQVTYVNRGTYVNPCTTSYRFTVKAGSKQQRNLLEYHSKRVGVRSVKELPVNNSN